VVERLTLLTAVYRVRAVEGAESPFVALAPSPPARTAVVVVLACAGSDLCDLALALPGLALEAER
jgi:hypothetical protein